MGYPLYFLCGTALLLAISSPCNTIKVDFGTRKGPIIPPTSTLAPTVDPNNIHDPAPVYESRANDIPNPVTYRPYSPYQYRHKINAAYEKAPISIYYGTEYDQKYNGRDLPIQTLRKIAKYNAEAQKQYNLKAKKPLGTVSGRSVTDTEVPQNDDNKSTTPPTNTANPLEYRGPQTFGPEHYDPPKPVYFVQYFNQQPQKHYVPEQHVVQQFGILYSNGVKYYIPRLDDHNNAEGDTNSVYDSQDIKYNNRY